MKRKPGQLENDTLALLIYVSKHPNEYQTQKILADAITVSQQRISLILRSVSPDNRDVRYGPNESCIYRTATKYGFRVRVYKHRKGLLLEAVEDGRIFYPE